MTAVIDPVVWQGEHSLYFPVRVVVQPSRLAGAAITLFHLLSAGVVAVHPLLGFVSVPSRGMTWLGVALLLALAVSFRHSLRGWQQQRQEIILYGDGSLECFSPAAIAASARSGRVALRGELTDLGWALWFKLATTDRPRSLMLWRDSCSAAHWRLLRIWLRHKARQAGGSALSGDG